GTFRPKPDREETESGDSKDVVAEPSPDPWPELVDGAQLFSETRATINRFVCCEPQQAVAVALWIGLTYVYNAFNILPLLLISSPKPECGKSILIDLCYCLCD